MNHAARVQAWSSVPAAAALPLLYLGGTQQMQALSIVGLAVFALSMLASPAIRYLSRSKS